MEALFANLSAHYPFLAQYKYLLIYLASSIEGFSTLFLAGFLVSVHTISYIPTFLVLFAGEVTNGFFWYTVGYIGGAKPVDWLTRKNTKQRQLIARARSYFERYTGRAIILAKVTFSLTILTQVLVGSLKYNVKKFTIFNLIGSFVWVGLILTVGYFFGEGYKAFVDYWENLSHLIIYAFLALLLIYGIRIAMRSLLFHYLALVEKVQQLGGKIKSRLDKFIAPDGDGEEVDK